MKKLAALLLVLVLVFSFAACGVKPADEKKDDQGNNSITGEPGHYFTVNGVDVKMGVLAKDVLEALGGEPKYTESPSCAFDGVDKNYNYGGYIITTYPDGDKDYILSARFVDDSVTTKEGVYIGSTKAAVEEKYGSGCFDDEGVATLSKGNTELIIFLEDDEVVEIRYDLILD